MTEVAVGSVVTAVYWETVPDKYQPPTKFSDPAEAFDYAEQRALWLELAVVFADGEVRVGTDRGPGPYPAVGDTVRRVEYQLQRWEDHDGPVTFPDRAAATAAAVPGRRSGLYQTLWIGPHDVRLISTIGAVDKT